MTSNQIALKPFVTRLAQREGMSYEQMVQTQAAGLAEVPEDQFTQDAQVRGSVDFARALNLKASDVAEMKADFGRAGVKPRVIDGLVSMMAVTAMALEPTAAVGLDSAMRLLLMDQKPLPTSAVHDGKLDLQPAMAQMASELGTDVPGMLAQTVEEYKAATPEQLGGARIDAILKTASVFPVVPGEVERLQEDLKSQGLDAQRADLLTSTLILGAVGFEPTLRPGLNQIFNLHYRQEKPMEQSAFEPLA